MPSVIMGDSIARFGPPTWVDQVWNGSALNLSRSGSLTRWWAKNPDHFVDSIEPGQSWYILLGSNDALWHGVAKHYSRHMNTLVDELMVRGVTDIHLIHSPSNGSPTTDAAALEAINRRLEWFKKVDLQICSIHHEVQCGPDLYANLVHPEDFAKDQLHLSPAGHAHVAAMVPEPTLLSSLLLGIVGLALAARFKHRRSSLR
jgi:lysophospholipase L1-like esterase